MDYTAFPETFPDPLNVEILDGLVEHLSEADLPWLMWGYGAAVVYVAEQFTEAKQCLQEILSISQLPPFIIEYFDQYLPENAKTMLFERFKVREIVQQMILRTIQAGRAEIQQAQAFSVPQYTDPSKLAA